MAKKVAVIAVNPVNGAGLFQYLEAFFENGISYKVFAVADSPRIKTNSGIVIVADDVITNLRGHEDDYDAVVFSCGDAMIPSNFGANASKQFVKDMNEVLKTFHDKGKMIVGHCAAAILFDSLSGAAGRRMALHPLAKPAIQHGVASDAPFEVDGIFYTAQTENTVPQLIGRLLEALK